jgi:hypothetical protein
LGKKGDPISKITRVKRAGGLAKAVEHLLSKCKVLSSKPCTTKNKNKTGTVAQQKQEDTEFKTRLGNIVRAYFKKQKKEKARHNCSCL